MAEAYWLPTCRMRPDFAWASISILHSGNLCTIGFST